MYESLLTAWQTDACSLLGIVGNLTLARETELMERWVDIGRKEQAVVRVEQARAVLARIIGSV